MSIILDGTSGITSPGGDTATVSVATPIVKSPSSLTLQTNGSTTAVTIDTAQNVSIGGSVNGNTKVIIEKSSSLTLNPFGNAGVSTLSLKNTSSTANAGTYITNFNAAGVLNSYIGFINEDTSYASDIVFGTVSASATTYGERLRINSTGAIVLSGGNTSANGVGISFPATQSASSDANTLDDYEEGTWTPTLNFGGASGVTTYGQRNGTYTKVGNVVTVRAYIQITTKSAATGTATLDGLPFTTNGASVNYASSFGYFSGQLITGSFMCYIAGGATGIQLGQTNGTTGFASLTNTNFVNAGDVIFQTTYIAV